MVLCGRRFCLVKVGGSSQSKQTLHTLQNSSKSTQKYLQLWWFFSLFVISSAAHLYFYSKANFRSFLSHSNTTYLLSQALFHRTLIIWGRDIFSILWLERLLGEKEVEEKKKKKVEWASITTWNLFNLKSQPSFWESIPFLWQDTDIQWPIRLIIGCPFGGSELLCGAPTQVSDIGSPWELRPKPQTLRSGAAALAPGTDACMPVLPELFRLCDDTRAHWQPREHKESSLTGSTGLGVLSNIQMGILGKD